MIICKKCGTENEDGSIFCSQCGKRVDGKKICPGCNSLINEENVYCNHCGARVDGKKVCENCQTVYEGEFCTACGKKSKTEAQIKTVKSVMRGNSGKLDGILEIIKNSLLATTIFLLLIFSFFVGQRLIVEQRADSLTTSTGTSFYFLITIFKDLKELLTTLKASGVSVYPEYKIGTLVPAIMQAVVVGANMIICTVFGILGLVRFGKSFTSDQKDKDVNLLKYIKIPVVTTLVSYSIIMSSLMGADVMDVNVSVKLNVASILNIIFCSVLLVGALVLSCIQKRKTMNNAKSISSLVLSSCGAFLAILVVSLCGRELLSATAAGSVSSTSVVTSIGVGVVSLFVVIFSGAGTLDTVPKEVSDAMAGAIIYLVVYILILGICALILKLFLDKFDKDKKTGNSGLLAFSIVNLVLSVIYFVFVLISKSGSNGSTTSVPEISTTVSAYGSVGYSSIIALIFGILILAIVIAKMVIDKKEIKEIENEE